VSTKICGYCGRQNAEEAVVCRECGTKFAGDREVPVDAFWKEWARPISSRSKWVLWFAAWGVVVLAIKPANLWAAPYFPLGLLAVFPRGDKVAIMLGMSFLPAVLGWGIYALLSAAIDRSKKKGVFLLIYVVFCTLLALNVVGCRKTLSALSGIE
jgi:hypothetical protein